MKVRVALCQMAVGEDKQQNISAARAAVKKAAQQGAQLVVLPEMWNCPYSNASFPIYAEDLEGGASESADALACMARDAGVVLVGGSVPERSEGNLYNTCCVYDSDGSLLAKHRKTHLFDINIPGKITFKESDTLTPGSALTAVDTRVGRLGIGICYDLRFPEMAHVYAERGAQILVYPGAFNMTTGPVHWELLQRARALDNQLFVVSCSPARDASASYQAWGHSCAVGPYGNVLASAAAEADVIMADLDLDEITVQRDNIPVSKQKRSDLYSIVDASVP